MLQRTLLSVLPLGGLAAGLSLEQEHPAFGVMPRDLAQQFEPQICYTYITARCSPTYVTIFLGPEETDVIPGPATISTIPAVGNIPGTILIEAPVTVQTTITVPYTDPAPATGPVTTTVGGVGPAALGTVIVQSPSFTTIVEPYTGTDSVDGLTRVVIPASGTVLGTVIIQTPFVTVTEPYTGTDTLRPPVPVTTIAPTGGDPGTVVVAFSVTESVDVVDPTAVTIEPSAGSPLATVVDGTTFAIVTLPYTGTEPLTGPTTVSTILPTGTTDIGTYIVFSLTETSGPEETYTPEATSEPATNAVTVVDGTSFAIVTLPYTGTDSPTGATTVSTILPTGATDIGTIIVAFSVTETSVPEQTYVPETTSELATNAVTVVDGTSFDIVTLPYTGTDSLTGPTTVSTILPTGTTDIGTIIVVFSVTETSVPEQTYVPETTSDLATNAITVVDGTSFAVVTLPFTGTESLTGPTTISTILPTGTTDIGTVIVFSVTGTSEPEQTYVPETTSDLIAGAVTVVDGTSFAIVTLPYTGTESLTGSTTISTILPTGTTDIGTVIVFSVTGTSEPEQTYVPETTSDLVVGAVTVVDGTSYTIVTVPYTGIEPLTEPTTVSTLTPTGGTEFGTLVVIEPAETLLQSSPASVTDSITVVDGTSYEIITQANTGITPVTEPITIATIVPTGTDIGTIIVVGPQETPPPPTSSELVTDSITIVDGTTYAIVTQPYTNTELPLTETITVFTIAATGTEPGTLIVIEPQETLAPASSDTPTGSVTVIDGTSYEIVTQTITGTESLLTEPVTISTITPTGTEFGTLVVVVEPEETPLTEVPVSSISSNLVTVVDGTSYTIVTQEYTGTESLTEPITISTIVPTGTEIGTLVVVEPTSELVPLVSSTGLTSVTVVDGTSYVIVTQSYTGTDSLSAPTTVSTVFPTGTEPGTVFVFELPGETETPISYTLEVEPSETVVAGTTYDIITQLYTGTESLSEPITVSTIPATGTEPGTIVVVAVTTDEATPSTEIPVTEPSETVVGGTTYDITTQLYTGTESLSESTIITIQAIGTEPGTIIVVVTTDEEIPVTETPVTETPVTETPVTETPVTETPVTETPVTETPVTETPVTETSVAETPVTETLVTETPVTELPVTVLGGTTYDITTQVYTGTESLSEPTTITVEATGTEPGTIIVVVTTNEETAATETPVTETPVTETPVTETPVTETPVTELLETVLGGTTYDITTQVYTGTESLSEPTTITVQATGTEPGTVIILTPSGEETPVSVTPEPSLTIVPLETPSITVVGGTSYVIVTQEYTGTELLTEPTTISTISATGTEPGSIFVFGISETASEDMYTPETGFPSDGTYVTPTDEPTDVSTGASTAETGLPSDGPYVAPTDEPTETSTAGPSLPSDGSYVAPTDEPTETSTAGPTLPSDGLYVEPAETELPSDGPYIAPTDEPTETSTAGPILPSDGPYIAPTDELVDLSTSTSTAEIGLPSDGPYNATSVTEPEPAPNFEVNSEPPGPPFACEDKAFFLYGRQIADLDLLSGESKVIRDRIGPGSELNALGYNMVDNYLYAVSLSVERRCLVRIASDGASTIVSDLDTELMDLRAGDITEYGRYFVFTTTDRTEWIEIDVDPSSPDYGRIVSSGSSSFVGFPVNCIRDIAYVPNTARFYAVATYEPLVSALISWDPATNAWELIEQYGYLSGNNLWPAVYAADDGYVYASAEVSYEVFSFPTSGGKPTRLTRGPAKNVFDGARCFSGGPVMAMYQLPTVPWNPLGWLFGGK